MKPGICALVIGCSAVLSGGIAHAEKVSEVQARLAALERENAAMRKENAALRENKSLREQNTNLRKSVREPRHETPAPLKESKPRMFSGVFDALAADLPAAYKAAPVVSAPGQFRIWAEGGAIWTGGDPVTRDFILADFTTSIPLLGIFGGGVGGFTPIPGQFELTPKIGWSAATGFDYRFPGSRWHVNGAFRYGEGGVTEGSAQSSGSLDPALSALLGGGVTVNANGAQVITANYREAHWIADIGAGYDVVGNGANAMQFKGGLRVAEFVAKTSETNALSGSTTFDPAVDLGGLGVLVNSVSLAATTLSEIRASFLGAGPRIGIEGSVPFAGNWVFDYLGDAAVLFGTQTTRTTDTTRVTVSPAVLAVLGGFNNRINTSVAERFATVFSADVQVGIGYWVTPNVKVAASYRLDAMINVQNQENPAVANFTPDRYTHGPRLAVTGQF